MTVESVTYITDLNPALPAAGDNISEGDDHVRNLKTGILGTFSGFTGIACTATEAELNDVGQIRTDLTTAEADIDALEADKGYWGHIRESGTIEAGEADFVSSGSVNKTSTGDYTVTLPATASNGWIVTCMRSNQNDSAFFSVSTITAVTTTSFSVNWSAVTGGASEGNDVDQEFHFHAFPY